MWCETGGSRWTRISLEKKTRTFFFFHFRNRLLYELTITHERDARVEEGRK